MCGKDVMSPTKKCNYILKNAYDDCTTKVARWLCSPVPVLRRALCPALRIADAICKIPSRIADNLESHLNTKFEKVFNRFKEVCQVKVEHKSSMHFNVNQTKSMKQAMDDMKKNIAETLLPHDGGMTLECVKIIFPILMLIYSLKISYNSVKKFKEDDSWYNTVVNKTFGDKIDDDREARG